MGGITHTGNVPAIGDKACSHVLAESPVCVTFDGNLVVVVDPTQVRKFEMASQGGGLAGHPFHHAAVTTQGVNVIIEQIDAGTIEVLGHPLPSNGHPDTGGNSLTQGTGCRFNAGSPAILRVAGTLAVKLAKSLDVLQGYRQLPQLLVFGVHRLDLAQVQQRIQQHRSMANGEDKAIAIGPNRVIGIEPQKSLPEAVDYWCHGHRGARVTGGSLLNRIHGQGANRVDTQLISLLLDINLRLANHCFPSSGFSHASLRSI